VTRRRNCNRPTVCGLPIDNMVKLSLLGHLRQPDTSAAIFRQPVHPLVVTDNGSAALAHAAVCVQPAAITDGRSRLAGLTARLLQSSSRPDRMPTGAAMVLAWCQLPG
jgi:hypothetical protein